jgi:hypothetical protein
MWLFLAGGLLFAGVAIYFVTAFINITQGQTQIRPRQALKYATITFPLSMVIQYGWYHLINENPQKTIFEMLFFGGVLSLAIGFSSTAYRRPK